jgi:7-cyano-7-deazaguanine synthase in queuosine biosynthesis
MQTIVSKSDRLLLEELDEVCLFSGGLDSLIGALDLLKEGRRPLLVSHYWDAETSKAQTSLLKKLVAKYAKSEIHSVRVRLGFDRNHLGTEQTEETQRSRSFLFFALAALATSTLGEDVRIHVPENGLIALNVPLDPLRLGALSTRTTHPHFIAAMNGLLDRLGNLARLENRYRHQTKGEMVSGCRDLGFLREEVENSMSCSSPAKARWAGLSPRHCGYCVPCLIRRASLKTGLDQADPTLYTVSDLKAAPLDTTEAEGEHIRSFQLMAQRITAAPDLAHILIHKPGPLPRDQNELEEFAGVFRRGTLEVAGLLEGVKAIPK